MGRKTRYENSPSLVSEFIDGTRDKDAKDGNVSIRRQIIDEYPRLRALMEEKNWTRQDLYNYFIEATQSDVTEKTFYNYLTDGNATMRKKMKEEEEEKMRLASMKNPNGAEALASSEKPCWLGIYDLSRSYGFAEAVMGAKESMDWLKPGLPLGHIGSRLGAGCVGKTWFSLEESIAIAIGREFCGHQYKRGAVLYISGQDQSEVLQERMKVIAQAFNLSSKEKEMLVENFMLWSLCGCDCDLLGKKDDKYVMEETIINHMKRRPFYRNDYLRLIVFDSIRNFHFTEEDHDPSMMKLLDRLESLCRKLNCSIIFTHNHMMPALTDLIGLEELLSQREDGKFELKVIKLRYSKSIDPVLLERNNDGLLLPVK